MASSKAPCSTRVTSPGIPAPITWSSTSRTGTLGGGPGQEHLTGEIHLGAGESALDDRVTEVARDLDQGPPGDAVDHKGVLPGRGDLAVLDDVDVLTVEHVAVVVEQDHLLIAGLD